MVLEATPRELEAALERFEPDAVVCNRPSAEYPSGGKGAWVELPTEPAQTGDIYIGGDHEGAVNLGLRRVLSILDEAEERLRRGALAEGCEACWANPRPHRVKYLPRSRRNSA